MQEAGLGWGVAYCHWEIIQPKSDSYDFRDLDAPLRQMCMDQPFGKYQPVVPLQNCPTWASTRIETTWIVLPDTFGDGGVFKVDTCTHCAPRGLDSTGPGNHWTSFIDTLLGHWDQCVANPVWRPCDRVHIWEINNENNDLETLNTFTGITGWWQRPNLCYSIAPTPWSLCSLYIVQARQAEQTIHNRPGHLHDTILISSVHRVHESLSYPHNWLVAGKDWIRLCYEVSEQLYTGPFWDGVSVHAYQGGPGFSPHDLEEDADTVRAIMREYGQEGGLLWNTEFGWGIDEELTQEQDARNLCQSFSTTAGSWARPEGGFDRMCWWYSYRPPGGGSWGLLDSDLAPQPNFYAFKQTAQALTGKRFNGRVMTGDAATDAHVRMYEFETNDTLHKRTWVCWKNGDVGQDPVSVQIPVRADSVARESLAYDADQQAEDDSADSDGWLRDALSDRPVFFSEGGTALRPDVKVDSIRLAPPQPIAGGPLTAQVYFRNAGNAPTPPTALPDPGPHLTWVVLRHNGDSVAQTWRSQQLNPGDTESVSISVGLVPGNWNGPALFSADVNPGQRYVELGMDDNSAYKRVCVRIFPPGKVDAVVPPGGKTDAALLPLRLESHSWESDSTGLTPADSARILFAWYGQHDSVVHAEDTTAWFPFCADTALQFPRGCGKFKVYAQFRDSGADDSPAYPDSADTVVVFDSVPAVGNLVINAGARFAPSATCTLRLAAYDSASGVYGMRFSNRTPVNLVRNGTFAATGGSWSFTNGGYDSSLQMGLLSVSPSAESRARQFVPVESISAHYGDSCVLEASILTHMHGGSASGDVSFSYFRTRTNPLLYDTVWLSLGSASYSGDVISLTGRYNLSARFLLAQPTSYPGWVWRGGMVKVRAQGVTNGTGHVLTDNVSLNLFQPQSGCTWWGAYDTLAAWNMGSTAGQHVVRELLIDSAGTENAVALADTVILDPTAPTVHISLPQLGQYVSHTVEITGWAYDSIEVASDTWFASRRLFYRHQDSTN